MQYHVSKAIPYISSHKKYLFVALLDNLVAGVAPHSQVLPVILNYQLRDLQGLKRH